MGSIVRGMGRAVFGATVSTCFRRAPAFPDSHLSHSQAMILGGVTPAFLLFDSAKARAKRAAMFPRSVLLAAAVSAFKRLRAILPREER